MEYMSYDYKHVSSNITIKNYMNFVLDKNAYKYYLNDIFLSKYDSTDDTNTTNKSFFYCRCIKLLYVIPYVFVATSIIFKVKAGFFRSLNLDKEFYYIFKLFTLFYCFRLSSLCIIKYIGDNMFILNKHI